MQEILEQQARKGRGAVTNHTNRYEPYAHVPADDGWESWQEVAEQKLHTTVQRDTTRTIIARNDSPDIGFSQSINPYRGCEHGCVYCFARPTHAYLGLSPGLDFESKLFYKPEAAKLLEAELRHPRYKVSTMAMGTNTDPYQPIERDYQVTRQILEVLNRFNHPVAIVTKSDLVTRDIDILAPMAERGLAKVFISITSLQAQLARTIEPRAATPPKRLQALRILTAAGIPTGIMAAPMIPALNDHELESILDAAHAVGVTAAGYTLIRLPLEVRPLFEEWLKVHVPNKAKHIMSLIRQCHDGKAYKADWGTRMRGQGPYADLLKQRFAKACARLELNRLDHELDHTQFKAPPASGEQLRFL